MRPVVQHHSRNTINDLFTGRRDNDQIIMFIDDIYFKIPDTSFVSVFLFKIVYLRKQRRTINLSCEKDIAKVLSDDPQLKPGKL